MEEGNIFKKHTIFLFLPSALWEEYRNPKGLQGKGYMLTQVKHVIWAREKLCVLLGGPGKSCVCYRAGGGEAVCVTE